MHRNKIWGNNNLTTTKGKRLKMAYNVVTLTILFESAPKWFLCFQNDPHVEHQLPELMCLQIQIDPYEYWIRVSCMDPLSQGPLVHRIQ